MPPAKPHRPAITDIALAEMPRCAEKLGLKPYAANQIISWLYKRRVASFDEMTNLSRGARDLLRSRFAIEAVRVDGLQRASDGAAKLLCRAPDGAAVECVLIPAENGRTTVCLSTQVGCAMGCTFCRTAKMGFIRNLTQGEILGQLLAARRASPSEITNVVLMGMGEPLLNASAVGNTVEFLLDERAFGLSRRRVTLSTCGLLPELKSFCARHDIKIAISLNATTDEVRSRLMPVNRKHPLAEIMEFCRAYAKGSHHRVTFEYVLIRGVNDAREDGARLVALVRGMRAKVNLIPFNPFPGSRLKVPEGPTVEWWREFLYAKGIQANVRASRGQGILAACGQLLLTVP